MLRAQQSIRGALGLAAVMILIPLPTAADDVHNDDVVVQGNMCVGSTGCVDGRIFSGDLEVESIEPEIILFDSTAGSDDWEIEANAGELRLKNWLDAGGTPIEVVRLITGARENSLVIDDEGSVGVGTSTPGQELHLLFTSPSIRFEDSDGGQVWDVNGNSTGFRVRDNSAGNVNRLWIEPGTGNVGIGTSSPAVKLHVLGDTTIDGDFRVLSSRRAKEILSPVTASEVLAALERLPLVTWRYKEDPGGAVHLGPTSEAFHAAFGLGVDSEHLSPVDTAGVAMASIQELARLVEAQARLVDAQAQAIAELRSERRDLVRRLERLESSRAR